MSQITDTVVPSKKGYVMRREIELSISCQDCVRRSTPDCADCLVSFVLGETPEAMELTAQDANVVELLTAGGLLPTLKFDRAEH
jgi:hypothetical protein